MDWLYQHLNDPLSAKVEWQGEPKKGDLPDARGRKVYGYLGLFSVNSGTNSTFTPENKRTAR